MVVSLEPAQIAFNLKLERGKLVRFASPQSGKPAPGTTPNETFETLTFQYNPSTITRTRTGRWEPRKQRKGSVGSPADIRGRATGGTASLLAESETIGFKLIFDATEAILANRSGDGRTVSETGILPELAFLDLISLGREEQDARNSKTASKTKKAETVQPIKADTLLLVLGIQRIIPVVLTSLTITEQKFNPSLMPIRAEADVRFNVLEPVESAYNTWIKAAFDQLFKQRQTMSRQASATSPDDTANTAIANALQPPSGATWI